MNLYRKQCTKDLYGNYSSYAMHTPTPFHLYAPTHTLNHNATAQKITNGINNATALLHVFPAAPELLSLSPNGNP